MPLTLWRYFLGIGRHQEVIGEGWITLERYLWATAILDSRMIWWDGRKHLVPLLDLVSPPISGANRRTGKRGGVFGSIDEGLVPTLEINTVLRIIQNSSVNRVGVSNPTKCIRLRPCSTILEIDPSSTEALAGRYLPLAARFDHLLGRTCSINQAMDTPRRPDSLYGMIREFWTSFPCYPYGEDDHYFSLALLSLAYFFNR